LLLTRLVVMHSLYGARVPRPALEEEAHRCLSRSEGVYRMSTAQRTCRCQWSKLVTSLASRAKASRPPLGCAETRYFSTPPGDHQSTSGSRGEAAQNPKKAFGEEGRGSAGASRRRECATVVSAVEYCINNQQSPSQRCVALPTDGPTAVGRPCWIAPGTGYLSPRPAPPGLRDAR